MNDKKEAGVELPPLPNNPEPTFKWTQAERDVIGEYTQAAILADRAARAPDNALNVEITKALDDLCNIEMPKEKWVSISNALHHAWQALFRPAARAPVQVAGSVDTPEFRLLLADVQGWRDRKPVMTPASKALIAHLDAVMRGSKNA